jgi:hypothetical protein
MDAHAQLIADLEASESVDDVDWALRAWAMRTEGDDHGPKDVLGGADGRGERGRRILIGSAACVSNAMMQ